MGESNVVLGCDYVGGGWGVWWESGRCVRVERKVEGCRKGSERV